MKVHNIPGACVCICNGQGKLWHSESWNTLADPGLVRNCWSQSILWIDIQLDWHSPKNEASAWFPANFPTWWARWASGERTPQKGFGSGLQTPSLWELPTTSQAASSGKALTMGWHKAAGSRARLGRAPCGSWLGFWSHGNFGFHSKSGVIPNSGITKSSPTVK